MHAKLRIARALATAFLADRFEIDELVDRASDLLGRRWRWLRPLARRLCDRFRGELRPRKVEVARFILDDDGFSKAAGKYELRLVHRPIEPPAMSPIAAASTWNASTIRSPGELADWLGIAIGEMDWFADLRTFESKRSLGRLRHYHYRTLTKRFGKIRLIEAPKPRLKEIQRRILVDILDRVPPHEAAHGFRRGRSIKTFAAPHTGREVVLKIDLEEFFPSISRAQVQAIFRAVGYPESVADLLAGLCTNATPDDVWREPEMPSPNLLMGRAMRLYARPHLPQGAPTSPALANLCAYRMDCRLAGLANSAGASYTRYADDLAFSGDCEFTRMVNRFHLRVCAIVLEEGFAVHHRKTRIMRQGVRQRLAGIVVNERLNVIRADYDRLKATLTNCVRHGAPSQNRAGRDDFAAHLLGQISFVEMVNSRRGHKLRGLFERIAW